MGRITITLPDDVDARLRLEARRRSCSVAAVAREALDRHLPQPKVSARRHLSFFGIGEGSPADVSERIEDFIGQALSR